MQFELGPEDVAFRDELQAFIQANDDALGDQTAWHQRLVDGGWVVPSWPSRWGGRDATITQEMVYNQELAAVDAPIPLNSIGLFNIGPMLLHVGTLDQQERYLPPMVRAEEIWCQGFSEPGAGSDLAALTTRAVDAGDHWTVTGQKVWTTFANEASQCLALVRTDPDTSGSGPDKHKGISALIIDMDQPGVEVRPLRELTGEEGFNEIFFDAAVVPKDRLVGELHGGWRVAMSTLTYERLGTMKLGIQLSQRLQQVLELARGLGRDRDPVVRQQLAALGVQVDLMQLLTEQALRVLQRGQDPGVSLPLGKLQWADLMQQLAETALSLQGQAAMLYRDPRAVPGDWQYHTLYSRMTTIGAGTTQVQKNILAYRTLGLPRDADASPGPSRLEPPTEDEAVAAFRAGLRRLLEDRCPTAWVRTMLDDGRGTTDEVWKELAALGAAGVLVPEEHGGTGLGYVAVGHVLEELGRAVHPGPFASSALAAVAATLEIGSDRDRADLLPGLADGSVVGTLVLPGLPSGTVTGDDDVRARTDGSGWRITGTTRYVPDGATANLLLVPARTEEAVGLFAVRADDPGVTTTPLKTLDQTKKLADVVFNAAAARRLGEGDVTTALARVRDRVVAGTVVETAGVAARALELANDYAKVRVQFDRPIGSFQAVQHLLADMVRAVELARAGGFAALRAADRGDEPDCHRAALAAAAHAAEALVRVTADAIQVFGGIGFTWEHDAHLYYRRALASASTFGGSSELHEAYARVLLDR